jgi:hypothetical protein
LGPKIVLLGKQSGALMQYLLLLTIFILSFGIFIEGIANPVFPIRFFSGENNHDWYGALPSLAAMSPWQPSVLQR